MKRNTVLVILMFLLLNCNSEKQDVPSSENATYADKNAALNLPFRPNILWLVAEDLSPVIPPFGDSTITTPTLSRLAAEGVRYPNLFSPSGVCAPSRAAIAMGMYPARVGAHQMRTGPWYIGQLPKEKIEEYAQYMPEGLVPYEAVPPADARMHSEYLRMAAYYCSNRYKQDYQFIAPATAWDDCSPTAHWRNRRHGQAFFSIFNFEVTHESRIWTKADDSLWIDDKLDIPVPPYLPNTEVGKKDVRRMYSNVKEMDFQVGQILEELEKDNLLDSTIVFWYTDHGGPLPRQKRLCYDSGLKVPMIIRFPNAWRATEVDSQLVSFVDFLPTILSLAGVEPPKNIDGQAFLGKYKASKKRKYIHAAADRFDEKYDMIRAVRDNRFKYLRNYNTEKPYYLAVNYRENMPIMKELLRLKEKGQLTAAQAQWFRPSKSPEELFDTQNDPHELHNLANQARYAEKLEELRQECDQWMEAIEDKGLIPEEAFIQQIWPEKRQPLTAPPVITIKAEKVMLTCATPGASIGYKLIDKNAPSPLSWTIYSKPFILPEGASIEVMAHRIGFAPSDKVTKSNKK